MYTSQVKVETEAIFSLKPFKKELKSELLNFVLRFSARSEI